MPARRAAKKKAGKSKIPAAGKNPKGLTSGKGKFPAGLFGRK